MEHNDGTDGLIARLFVSTVLLSLFVLSAKLLTIIFQNSFLPESHLLKHIIFIKDTYTP